MKKQDNSSEEKKRVTGSEKEKKRTTGIKKNKKDDENDDPQLQEFLQVMHHGNSSKLWANDTLAAPSLQQSKVASDNNSKVANGHERKLDGENSNTEEVKGVKDVLSEEQEAEKPNKLVHDEVVSDIDYFRSRIKKTWSDSESSDSDGGADDTSHSDRDNNDEGSDSQYKTNHDTLEDTLKPDVSQREAEDGSSRECDIDGLADPSSSPKNKNDEVLESGRLFIRSLPYAATYVPYYSGYICSLPLHTHENICICSMFDHECPIVSSFTQSAVFISPKLPVGCCTVRRNYKITLANMVPFLRSILSLTKRQDVPRDLLMFFLLSRKLLQGIIA